MPRDEIVELLEVAGDLKIRGLQQPSPDEASAEAGPSLTAAQHKRKLDTGESVENIQIKTEIQCEEFSKKSKMESYEFENNHTYVENGLVENEFLPQANRDCSGTTDRSPLVSKQILQLYFA